MINGIINKRILKSDPKSAPLYIMGFFLTSVTFCDSFQKTGSGLKKISTYRPNKDHYKHFAMPVLGQSVSTNNWLASGMALCPGAGGAEKLKEIFYTSGLQEITFK